MKVITCCPHLKWNKGEPGRLAKMFYQKEQENRIFIIRELCKNCFGHLSRKIGSDEQNTTH